MASVERIETGDGIRWKVRWRNRADPKRHSATAHTFEAAKRIKLAAETAHDLGRPYLGPAAEAQAVADARVNLRIGLRDYLLDRQRAGWADGSIRQADIALTQFLNLLSEDDTYTDGALLTTASLGRLYTHLRGERGVSLGTAQARVQYVQRWWDWLGNSDTWGERVPRPRTIDMATPTPTRTPTAPTWQEMDRTIACAHEWYGRLMAVCRYTGLRANDQAMQLRRADLVDGWLTIRPDLGKTKQEKRGRIVPVSRHLLAMIESWPEDPDGWLIHVPKFSERHPGPVKRHAWNANAAGAWRRAGVRPEVWDTQLGADGLRRNGHPLHAFRRGVVSGLQALGADLADVQYLVGHKLDGGVTTDRYTDPAIVRKLQATVDLIPPPCPVAIRGISGGGVVAVRA